MLDKLFAPSSVAVVGASENPGKLGNQVLANLIRVDSKAPSTPSTQKLTRF